MPLPPRIYLSLSLSHPFLVISFRHSAFAYICVRLCLWCLSTLHPLSRLLSLFPSPRPPCEPTERFNPLPIVKINGDRARFFLHATLLRFDLRRGPSQCAAAAAKLPSISVPTKIDVCVFEPLLDDARRYAHLFI